MTTGTVTTGWEDRVMEVRNLNCFILWKEIEEIKGGMYVPRRTRLIFEKRLNSPLGMRDELGSVPLSLDEVGISLPPDLADRVWERPQSEWGDLGQVQDCFRKYESLFIERCAQMNRREMICAFEAAQEHAGFLKRSPMRDDDQMYQVYLDNVVRTFRAWFRDCQMPLPEEIRGIAIAVRASPPAPEQTSILDRYQAEFVARGLKKGKTVPREVLFEIAKKLVPEGVSPLDQFRSGDKSYQLARKAASDLGFKKLPRGDTLQQSY